MAAKKTKTTKTTQKKTTVRRKSSAPPRPAPRTAIRAGVKKRGAGQPQVGSVAPEFALEGSDGKTHRLSDHRGKPVVLYFYPKNDTPGCTRQACDFRDNFARVIGHGAAVYGVSRDSLASHAKFREKYELSFPLLSDPELVAHRAYGAWGQKSLYGRTFDGTIRSTFLIDGRGRVARVWPKVAVTGHVDEVLEALGELRAAR